MKWPRVLEYARLARLCAIDYNVVKQASSQIKTRDINVKLLFRRIIYTDSIKIEFHLCQLTLDSKILLYRTYPAIALAQLFSI